MPQSGSWPIVDVLGGPKQIFQGNSFPIDKFTVTSEQKADVFLVPHDAYFWTPDYISHLKAVQAIRPLIFFNRSDVPRRINLWNSWSLQNSKVNFSPLRQVVIPYSIVPVEGVGLRSISPQPRISFVGYIPKLTLGRLMLSARQGHPDFLINNSTIVRTLGTKKILKAFSKSSYVVLREHYGGAKKLIADPNIFRAQYVKSLLDSDYIFSPRGDANSSQRFFEVLSAGRIPIVPNSNISLPKTESSEKPTFISVDLLSNDLVHRVTSHWDGLKNREYKEIQLFNKRFYETNYNYPMFLYKLFSLDSDLNLSNYL